MLCLLCVFGYAGLNSIGGGWYSDFSLFVSFVYVRVFDCVNWVSLFMVGLWTWFAHVYVADFGCLICVWHALDCYTLYVIVLLYHACGWLWLGITCLMLVCILVTLVVVIVASVLMPSGYLVVSLDCLWFEWILLFTVYLLEFAIVLFA